MERFAKSPFWLTLLGGLLWWLGQPPVGWSALAWLAPLPWLTVIERPEPLSRKQWWGVWLAGVCYWLAALHWIRLPHPATIFGWPLLAGYMAVYLALFVAITRSVRQRLRTPLWLVAPNRVGRSRMGAAPLHERLSNGRAESFASVHAECDSDRGHRGGVWDFVRHAAVWLWAVGSGTEVGSLESGVRRTKKRDDRKIAAPSSRLQTPDSGLHRQRTRAARARGDCLLRFTTID